MESSATLNLLLEQAETARDAQQVILRNCETAATNAQAQADQLVAYRGQYNQRWSTHFRQPGSIELLQCVQGFSQRLEQAISHQAQVCAQAQNRVVQARAELLARETRVASVRKLIERRQTEQVRATERREQRSSDEFAQRRHGGSRLTPSLI